MSDDFRIIRESVRRHAHMFVGPQGALTLVLDGVDRAAEEHRHGECRSVDVTFDGDSVQIRDDGPGMPLDAARFLDVTVAERPWPGSARPQQQHAIGIGAYRALCRDLDIETVHAGRAMYVRFRDGEIVEPLTVAPSSAATGTTMRLCPDPSVFGDAPFSRRELTERFAELAHRAPHLRLTWSFEDGPA